MEYSGNTNTTNDPISSLLNPNPTFFTFPHDPNPTNHVYDHPTTFTGFQNNDVYLNSQPPETSRKPDHHPVGVSTKNPKKRTRASRRPATTVLTTDTTNFRQMVQEFTGIPTTPFTRRLDAFGSGGLFPVRPTVHNNNDNNNNNNLQQQSFDINGTVQKQTLLGLQNPIFSFQKQTLLESENPIFAFQKQLDVSCSSAVNDQTDKGNLDV